MTTNFDLCVKFPPRYDFEKAESSELNTPYQPLPYHDVDTLVATLSSLSLDQLAHLEEAVPVAYQRKIALETEDSKDNQSIMLIWEKLASAINEAVPSYVGSRPLDVFNSWFIRNFTQLVPLMGITTGSKENAFLADVLSCRHFNKVRQQVVDSAFEVFTGYRSTFAVWRRLARYIGSEDKPKRNEFLSYSFEECGYKALQFPAWFQRNFAQLSGIKKFDIRLRNITKLPAEIYTLTALEILRVLSNQMTKLPSAICNLANLTTLDLGENQLYSLDRGVGQLTKLKNLWIGTNRLESLPDELGRCSKLTMIIVNENSLKALPKGFENLSSRVVVVVDNYLLSSWMLLDVKLQCRAVQKGVYDFFKART